MPSKRKYLILIALSCLLANQTLQACSKNCIGCESKGKCIGCFHTKFIAHGRCGTDISDYEVNHCMIYYQNSKKCGWCAPGFDLSENSDECIQSTHYIDDCRYSVQVSNGSFCEICENSMPNLDSTKCIPVTRKVQKTKLLENCLWIKVNANESYSCVRCREGYSFNLETKVCERALIGGCWKHQRIGGDHECFLCDPWLGYASINVGKCEKVSDLFLRGRLKVAIETERIFI